MTIEEELIAVAARYGKPQLRKLQEEMTELSHAIDRLGNGRAGAMDEVGEELADVFILVLQARLILGEEWCDNWVEKKFEKLREKLSIEPEKNMIPWPNDEEIERAARDMK
jgi:NTP pyrophosphatase (non-canonical NTP hydrolase)